MSHRCNLHWREWGGDSVVFDARSGQTHQFAPLTAAVLAHIELQACSDDELAAAIAADLDSTVDEGLRAGLAAITDQLQRLSWIEAVCSP